MQSASGDCSRLPAATDMSKVSCGLAGVLLQHNALYRLLQYDILDFLLQKLTGRGRHIHHTTAMAELSFHFPCVIMGISGHKKFHIKLYKIRKEDCL
jgi:hypothetical protein